MSSMEREREARLSRISSRTDTEILDDGKGEKRHTIYYMNIEVGRKKYYLHKRYTEFLMLHQKLCEQQYPEVEDFDFPGKVWFNNFSDALIEYRRTRFEAYLTLLLELVHKYPPLRKEVEAFLGVPQTIDPPKRYPKTPVPGRDGRPPKGIKPLALLDDSTGGGDASASGAVTGAGALSGSGSGSSAASRRSSGLARKDSGSTVVGSPSTLGSPSTSPSAVPHSSSSPSSSPTPGSSGHGHSHSNPALNVLTYLFVYILAVGGFASAAALDPARARVCALSILALSFVASLLVSRAFAQARALQKQQLQQHQQQLHYYAAYQQPQRSVHYKAA